MGTVATLNTSQTTQLAYWIPEIWSKKVYEEAKARMYWNRFSGPEGAGMPIVIKRELLTQPGDIIHISRISNLTGTGVQGQSTLRGNEEQLSLSEVQVTPQWYRHAVASTGKAMKQINQDFRMKVTPGLSYWMAKKMDTSMWTAAQGTAACGFENSAITIIYANDAESADTLDSADTFSVSTIRQAAARLAANDIERISIPGMPAGEGYYLCFIHPYQAYNLKADTEWIENHRNASERGRDNPLFTGALGEIDGVIVHETTQCGRVQNGNTPAVYYSVAVMVGKEALCRGMNKDVSWSEQMDDYDFVQGIGIAAAWQDKVLSSNAIIQIYSAAVAPS